MVNSYPAVRFGAIAAIALVAATLQPAAHAQAQPQHSLQALFARIPKTPATPQEADKLVDASRQIPAIAALKADLEAHRAAVEKIVVAADAKVRARVGADPTAEQTLQGVNRAGAVAGIDMARMQTDKAYAQEMQARMRAMSPQELLAMSMAMQQGMGMRATVAVYDPPAVKAAAEAGQAVASPERQAARMATEQRRAAELDRKVSTVNEAYAARFPKMRMSCDGEGGGSPECQAERARYAAAMMPLLLARDAEVLRLEAAALDEERAALAAQVRSADQHLQAAQHGAVAQELGHATHIGMLDAFVVDGIHVLATKLEDIARRAALVTHCGPKVLHSAATCYGRQ